MIEMISTARESYELVNFSDPFFHQVTLLPIHRVLSV